MAEAVVGGVLLEDTISGLSKFITQALIKTWYFKSKLKEMQETLEIIEPNFKDMEKLNKKLDRREAETKRFMKLLQQAEDLVKKCEKIKWDLWKRYCHASKLDGVNKSLMNFVQLELQLQTAVISRETLVAVNDRETSKKKKEEGSSSGGPFQRFAAVGFKDRVKELKAMVLKDSADGGCSVVVVSAAGGCGKTTLVTELCHDPQIKSKFGEKNIYHVIIPEKYDIKAVVKKLLIGRTHVCEFESEEDAIKQWGSFLNQNKSDLLLVLDDVRSDSIIMKLKFKLPGYKILVTSREAFTQFSTYKLPALSNVDAISLFRRSAFLKDSNINIPDDLVEKLVKRCKNHPLALTVIGGLLNGKPVASWNRMSNTLSKGNKWFNKSHKYIQECLEKGLYLFMEDPELKECYLDLGLFPEDQKIAATAVLDMWAHLYKHDEDGSDTMDCLVTLSSKNLATMVPRRKQLTDIAHVCEEEFVTQHDMMRELAIHISSQETIEHRERLIINTDEKDIPQIVNARVLSISTGEISLWHEIDAPKVEVFVLNFMSDMHPLPRFMQKMESLKVLMITNYGYNSSEIQNFPAPQFLSGLTKIRLDHVSISSISTTILTLENLQKLSLIMCKIGNSFNQGTPTKLINLLEIIIDSCDDLVTFPVTFCNLARLQKLSITNCHEFTSISESFGELSNLEVLRLASCTKLEILPESTRNLKKLRLLDLYHCLSVRELPQHIGELGKLKIINLTGCTGLSQHELPKSVKDFDNVKVVCDEEISHLWRGCMNVEIEDAEEDPLDTFFKINPSGYK